MLRHVRGVDSHVGHHVDDHLGAGPPAVPADLTVDDHPVGVRDRGFDRERLAETPMQGQQAVLHEIFGQLPVAGQDVGETR